MSSPLMLRQGDWMIRTTSHEDRHGHEIVLHVDDCETILLSSVEGNSQQIWPPSPPVQQVVSEPISAFGDALLGVGMAGSNHWSACIQADSLRSFAFDIACRSSLPPNWLGSTYRWNSAVQVEQDGSRLSFQLPSDITAWLTIDDQMNLEVDQVALQLRLASQYSERLMAASQTYRWCYRFAW